MSAKQLYQNWVTVTYKEGERRRNTLHGENTETRTREGDKTAKMERWNETLQYVRSSVDYRFFHGSVWLKTNWPFILPDSQGWVVQNFYQWLTLKCY